MEEKNQTVCKNNTKSRELSISAVGAGLGNCASQSLFPGKIQ
jgi:hypothetical protein